MVFSMVASNIARHRSKLSIYQTLGRTNGARPLPERNTLAQPQPDQKPRGGGQRAGPTCRFTAVVSRSELQLIFLNTTKDLICSSREYLLLPMIPLP